MVKLNSDVPTVFQSPSGVLGVCRNEDDSSTGELPSFQSPSGVLGVCRTSWKLVKQTRYATFQSPSGVLGVCRAISGLCDGSEGRTSFSPLPGF